MSQYPVLPFPVPIGMISQLSVFDFAYMVSYFDKLSVNYQNLVIFIISYIVFMIINIMQLKQVRQISFKIEFFKIRKKSFIGFLPFVYFYYFNKLIINSLNDFTIKIIFYFFKVSNLTLYRSKDDAQLIIETIKNIHNLNYRDKESITIKEYKEIQQIVGLSLAILLISIVYFNNVSKYMIYLSFILAFIFGFRLNNYLLIYNDDIKKCLNFLPINQWMTVKNIKEFSLKHLVFYIIDLFLIIIWIMYSIIGLLGSFTNKSIKTLKQKINF